MTQRSAGYAANSLQPLQIGQDNMLENLAEQPENRISNDSYDDRNYESPTFDSFKRALGYSAVLKLKILLEKKKN